jgi:hypothetical protein
MTARRERPQQTVTGAASMERRENYRNAALGKLQPIPENPLWWAFRIAVEKAGRPLDVDNVAKTFMTPSAPGR